MSESFDFGRMNPDQIKAVKHIKHPCRVIAGAGSGKTTVLTKRIQYLLHKGVSPHKILAITFTKKAATEMKERLVKLVGDVGKDVFLGTFHSFGYSVIRKYCMDKNRKLPKIYMDNEKFILLARITSPTSGLTTGHLHDSYTSGDDLAAIIQFISWQKAFLIPPSGNLDFSCIQLGEGEVLTKEMESDYREIYTAYENTLHNIEQGIDLDDMLSMTYSIFKRNKDIAQQYIEHYPYILVDEFQDTNVAQYQLVKLLAGKGDQNVFIVGDARQAIYSWRASKVEFILNFENDWKNARTIELNDNYRSTVEIVDMSTELISHSSIKYPSICRSGRGNHGDRIFSFTTQNETTEAKLIGQIIYDAVMKKKKLHFSDFAILYRLNSQSRPFVDELTRLDIPHIVHGGDNYYDNKDIKALLAYPRLASNPDNLDFFKSVFSVPDRGISQKTIDLLIDKARNIGVTLLDCAEHYYKKQMREGNCNEEIMAICDTISTMNMIASMDADTRKNMRDMLEELDRETGIIAFFAERNRKKKSFKPDEGDGVGHIRNFISSCDRHKNTQALEKFIQNIEDNQNSSSDDKVQLMSYHRSKGLEFHTVFMAGMVNGILPHSKSIQLDEDGSIIPASIEEERRLCYVGITRAKETLYMSSYNFLGDKQVMPSIFFCELLPKTVDKSWLYKYIEDAEKKLGITK